MSKVFIFDIDGTLTPSRQKITKPFQQFFEKWIEKNPFYLVTGSDLLKLQEQMCFYDIEAERIFTCCGNEMWEPDPHTVNTGANLVYSNKFKPSDNLIKSLFCVPLPCIEIGLLSKTDSEKIFINDFFDLISSSIL